MSYPIMAQSSQASSTSVTPINSSSGENIRVCARFRPINKSEDRDRTCVSFQDNESLELVSSEGDAFPFTFSKVFRSDSSQEEVYRSIGEPVVRDVLEGYNGTIFVYGQTGSGKTYTMMGAELHHNGNTFQQQQQSSNNNSMFTSRGSVVNSALASPPQFHFDGPLAGIIPRAVFDLFDRIQRADAELVFDIKMFFVEIYMEHVRDLLEPSRTNLNVREDPSTNSFYVDGCECPYIGSAEEVLVYVEQGLRNRATASTKMNDVSSRSHCLLGLTIKSTHAHRGESKVGKLYLVDLAGSEKVAKTRAEGVQLEEAKLINKSLTMLGLVIKNLTESRSQHIPYRDSKLTKILQDALGGNSRTSLMVCCSPSVLHSQETHSTLRFGARAKKIQCYRLLKERSCGSRTASHRLQHWQQSSLPPPPLPRRLPQRPATWALPSWSWRPGFVRWPIFTNPNSPQKMSGFNSCSWSPMSARQQTQQQEEATNSLTEEVKAWQVEYQELTQELQLQSRRLDRERAGRTGDRALLEKLLDSTLQARNEVQWIRSITCEALREIQLQVAPSLAAAGAPGAAIGSLTMTQSGGLPPLASGAPSEALSAAGNNNPAQIIVHLSQRLHMVDKQYNDLEHSWRDLMNENGALMLEMQLADKKLAIRHDRIENLKAGLRQERDISKGLQDELEQERKGYKDKVIEARSDAEYWRHRFEAMQQAFLQARSGGSFDKNLNSSSSSGLAATTSSVTAAALGSLTPQHSRVIKHIRGGVRVSPPSASHTRESSTAVAERD
ncbi:kinesin heavy chain, putative [Bodo saltans]|uniref:Kinesin-like protein n=1 Tax=Bodo saltans TaxID=75058 RepID=A0A0S4J3F5_BODSA|nr:kinesin heavy chain, putative [Bodo saltans]|eukprot:CUG67665.1 kinesin heavy chain, putative [Bodo saltans]